MLGEVGLLRCNCVTSQTDDDQTLRQRIRANLCQTVVRPLILFRTHIPYLICGRPRSVASTSSPILQQRGVSLLYPTTKMRLGLTFVRSLNLTSLKNMLHRASYARHHSLPVSITSFAQQLSEQ